MMIDRNEQIEAWQAWLWDQGIPSFPLFGIMNGVCRCQDRDLCRTPGKHPKMKGWRNLQGPIRAQATDNLGVSTDNLVLIDIDQGGIPDDLPQTFTVNTGRGFHLWYWARLDHPIRNSVGWRPKIDIRSVGGLAAAPPSRHVSGSEYTYVGGEIQPVPDVVINTQQRYEARERRDQVTEIPSDTHVFIQPTIDAMVEEISNAQEGERNHTLFRNLCRFFEMADKKWAGEDALRQIFDAAHGIGLSAQEIANTIESASRSLTK